MAVGEYHYTKDGIDVPSSCGLRCRGAWAGVMGHSLVIGHLVVHTHQGEFCYSPYLVEWPFDLLWNLMRVQCVLEDKQQYAHTVRLFVLRLMSSLQF